MIDFNELRITPDGKELIMDVAVSSISYYDNMYIDTILIDTQSSYSSNGPSSKAVQVYKNSLTQGAQTVREVRLSLTEKDLNKSLNSNMFFVYVVLGGYVSPDTPCGGDNMIHMKPIVNMFPLYNSVLYSIKQLSDNCNINKELINSILQIKSIETSIRLGNYKQAFDLWKSFTDNTALITSFNCKCNGTIT